jgi:predicted GH43/DUF377 family glycosyl hydrolase
MTLKRRPENPIITRKDIPSIPPHLIDISSVFNPGAIKFNDRYLLMLRIQSRSRETSLLMAESHNGVKFEISNKPVQLSGIEQIKETIYHVYDPRITEIDGIFYIMFAIDMDSGCQLGLAKTINFEDFEFMGIVSNEDTRNGVLFPEKVEEMYLRLDRPNRVKLQDGPLTGDTIFLSESSDLIHWNQVGEVMSGRPHYWDELVGSGPPPVKTHRGWLHIYHGIATHFASVNIYQAGVVLLDLKDPSIILARGRYNILEPRQIYETVGQVPNVVFTTRVDLLKRTAKLKSITELQIHVSAWQQPPLMI